MGRDNYKKYVDDPVMSDLTILISVEDLINIAMGPPGKNVVNFKMVQTILHILARQMRLLSTHVDLRISEKYDTKKRDVSSSDETSSPQSSPRDKRRAKAGKTKETEDKAGRKDKDKAGTRDQEKIDKMTANEKKNAEKEKIKNMSPKEKRKYLKNKERDEKEFRDKEKEQNELEKITPMERHEYLKEKKTEEKMSPKERYSKDKDQKDLEKMTPKEREEYIREKEAVEKMTPKEKEKYLKKKEKWQKEERDLVKMTPEEKEELELRQMSPTEKEQYLKEKEQRELENIKSSKEKEKYRKEGAKLDKKSQNITEKARSASGTSIAISEAERQKGEKVLIVEKGSATRTGSRTRVGSIEVVTQSQFEMLEAVVKGLAEKAGPLPMPTLPDNETLRSELMRGSACLTDTMQAMQVSARVQAAEKALDRMVGLLTQLAAAGALPEEFTEQLDSVWSDLEAMQGKVSVSKVRPPSGVFRKSVAIDPQSHKTSRSEGLRSHRQSSVAGRQSFGATSTASRASSIGGVTHREMDDAVLALREEMLKSVNAMTSKASSSAETAAVTAKSVAEKLEIALNLDSRISTLHTLTNDYAEQLSGFDVGITTQMQSFQEQMCQMRGDLAAGLHQLQLANNNAETAAVLELTERYEGLETELDSTLTEHQNLTICQKQLGDELQSLVKAVEMLSEQKADTDEVLDGLRDKADLSRLAGLLSDEEFGKARAELEGRLELCYEKFQKQDNVWMGAIQDLKEVSQAKAELMQLFSLKEDTQNSLNGIQEKLRILAIELGEPKAALLTRVISKDGTCGACMEHALIVPSEPNMPHSLPALRPPPVPEPCVPVMSPPPQNPTPDDTKEHTCHRWVGGSRTLMKDSVTREKAVSVPACGPPVYKCTGYGSDGRLYLMSEEVVPCEECNKLNMGDFVEEPEELKQGKPQSQDEGAGDTVKITTVIPRCICTSPQ